MTTSSLWIPQRGHSFQSLETTQFLSHLHQPTPHFLHGHRPAHLTTALIELSCGCELSIQQTSGAQAHILRQHTALCPDGLAAHAGNDLSPCSAPRHLGHAPAANTISMSLHVEGVCSCATGLLAGAWRVDMRWSCAAKHSSREITTSLPKSLQTNCPPLSSQEVDGLAFFTVVVFLTVKAIIDKGG